MKRFLLNLLISIMLMLNIDIGFAEELQEILPRPSSQPSNFMIAQIPDTQGFMYSSTEIHCPHTNVSQINDMYEWIFSHHDSSCPADTKTGAGCYQYIFHVGDIVDGNGGDGDTMWSAAKNTYIQILNNNKVNVPFGFATGNHDYSGNGPGQGVYQPGNYDQAKDFLQTIYTQQGSYAPQFIAVSNEASSPFLAYKNFTIGHIKFIALNLPLGLPGNDAEFQTTQDFISKNQDSLIILNSHTFDSWGSSPNNEKLAQLYLNNKNVFMVLWGHEPSPVYPNGGFASIPGETISRASNMPSVFKYRFDYQEGANYSCSGSNMPQHPLLRIYSFSLDETNKTLTWQAYDVQSWNIQNSVYNDPAWDNAKNRINLGSKDITLLPNSQVTMDISKYIPTSLALDSNS